MASIFTGEVSLMLINPDLARYNNFACLLLPTALALPLPFVSAAFGGGGNAVLLLCVVVSAVSSTMTRYSLWELVPNLSRSVVGIRKKYFICYFNYLQKGGAMAKIMV